MFWAFNFVHLMILPSNLLLTPIMTMILRPIVILLPNFCVFLGEVLSASMKIFAGNMVVVLMHLEFYSLTRRDLNIKCILEYHEDTMTFISEPCISDTMMRRDLN